MSDETQETAQPQTAMLSRKERIKAESEKRIRTEITELFGVDVLVMQPDVGTFRKAQRGEIVDETNPDEVEAAEAASNDTDAGLYRMMLIMVVDPDTHEPIFDTADEIKALPIHKDVTKLIEIVGRLASMDELVGEMEKNSAETQSE